MSKVNVFWKIKSKIECCFQLGCMRREALRMSSSDGKYYCHISVDDTIKIFKDINKNRNIYKSVFENGTLKYLKKVHDTYGAVFSLYCYYAAGQGFDLSEVTDKFKLEFEENSNWLRFGFHAYNMTSDYSKSRYDEAKSDYERTVGELVRICGEKTVDRAVRLSRYRGNAQAIQAFKECKYGITALLSAEDNRGSYYLTAEQERCLKNHEIISVDGIKYIATDLRLENAVDEDFEKLFYGNPHVVIFTHEYYLSYSEIKFRLEKLCLDAMKNNYTFAFN